MSKYRQLLVFVVVFSALIGFVWLLGRAIYLTFTQADIPAFNESYVYVANILAGLVGGIVAAGFGQPPPAAAPGDLNLLSRNAVSLGNFITPDAPQTASPTASTRAHEVIGLTYAAVYVILGLAAIAAWTVDEKPPDLVKNLATVSIGLFIPIITSFFKENEA